MVRRRHGDDAIEAAERHRNLVLETLAMPYPAKVREASDGSARSSTSPGSARTTLDDCQNLVVQTSGARRSSAATRGASLLNETGPG
jgi:hypothetical protein